MKQVTKRLNINPKTRIRYLHLPNSLGVITIKYNKSHSARANGRKFPCKGLQSPHHTNSVDHEVILDFIYNALTTSYIMKVLISHEYLGNHG